MRKFSLRKTFFKISRGWGVGISEGQWAQAIQPYRWDNQGSKKTGTYWGVSHWSQDLLSAKPAVQLPLTPDQLPVTMTLLSCITADLMCDLCFISINHVDSLLTSWVSDVFNRTFDQSCHLFSFPFLTLEPVTVSAQWEDESYSVTRMFQLFLTRILITQDYKLTVLKAEISSFSTYMSWVNPNGTKTSSEVIKAKPQARINHLLEKARTSMAGVLNVFGSW